MILEMIEHKLSDRIQGKVFLKELYFISKHSTNNHNWLY